MVTAKVEIEVYPNALHGFCTASVYPTARLAENKWMLNALGPSWLRFTAL